MPRPRISLLGGLQFYAGNGEQIVVSARKVQALLAFLARHADLPQSRAKLAALLWEDSEESQQRASLRQALTVLRGARGLDAKLLISASADTVTLHSNRADIDAVAFERLAGEDTPEALEEAAAIYAGEFMEAFNPKAPAFEDWMTAERQSLRARAVGAMTRLLELRAAAGALDRAIEVALRLLGLDPLQEDVHRTLMVLYARQGRHASALRQFRLCRNVLRRELDVAPEPETESLFRDIQEKRRRKTEPAAIWPLASDDTVSVSNQETDADSFPFGEPTVPVAELRQVTVLCAELAEPVDGTGGDPEAAQLRSNRFGALARDVVAAYGGVAETYVGGSVAAFFGMPVAHGNDAERAARTALQIQSDWGVRAGSEGESSDIRIGIADGRVLVTQAVPPGGRTVAGGVVNAAGKLAANAGAGEPLVTDSVRQALWKLAETDEVHEITMPGAAGTLRAFRLERLRDEPRTMAGLVGRDPELGQIIGALKVCRQHSRGLVIHLRGEPGIGKTRLVEELKGAGREHGFACHLATALDFGASERRDVIGSLVRGLLGVDDVLDEEAAILRTLAEGFPGRFEPHLYDLLRLAQPERTRAIYNAMDNAARAQGAANTLAELVRCASARQPRLIVLEDMHWLDRPSLALTAAMAATVSDCPAVLATTARTESDPLDAEWRAMTGNCRLITLDLGPLSEQDALTLAKQHTGALNGFARKCVERSGGNPLFLEQLLHAEEFGGGLPGTVQSVVLARMDKLEVADRQALRAASIFGQRFAIAALRHLSGQPDYDCWPLVAQGLVRPYGEVFLFSHALVQEGAYSSLPGSERRELHRRAAEWFAEHDPIVTAEHLDRAEDTAAPAAYLTAARGQMRLHRYERALRLVERGLAIASDKADRFVLSCCRGELLHDLGKIGEAKAAYEEAFALAEDDADRCRAWLGLAAVKRITDDLDGALADVEKGEQAAERLGLLHEAARAHFLHGNLLFPRGDIEGCLREHERSLELARKTDSPELEATALGGLADAEYMRGRMLTAHQHYHRCVELAEQHDFGRISVANRPMVANMLWYIGDVAGAWRVVKRSIDDAEKVGHPRAEMLAHAMAHVGQLWLLEMDRAEEHIEIALEMSRRLGAPRFEAEMLAYRSDLYRLTGRRQQGFGDLQRSLSIFRQTGMAYFGPWALGLMALAARDAKTRERALAEGEALLAGSAIAHNHLNFRKDAIDACLAARDWTEARRQADALETFASREPMPWSTFFVARGRALAAHGRGRQDRILSDELARLKKEGERFGYRIAIPAIDSALKAEGI